MQIKSNPDRRCDTWWIYEEDDFSVSETGGLEEKF